MPFPASSATAQRWMLMLPMAFCLAVALETPDRNWRLASVLGLLVLGQAREVLLMQEAVQMQEEARSRAMGDARQNDGAPAGRAAASAMADGLSKSKRPVAGIAPAATGSPGPQNEEAAARRSFAVYQMTNRPGIRRS